MWLGYDNPAMTTYVPLYAGVEDLPDEYETDGRSTGFSRRSAWWAFNRVATLAAHRWGDMRADVAEVRALFAALLGSRTPATDDIARLLETVAHLHVLASSREASFRLLGLIRFYTLANRKLQAWEVPSGTRAPQAAGQIHTDM